MNLSPYLKIETVKKSDPVVKASSQGEHIKFSSPDALQGNVKGQDICFNAASQASNSFSVPSINSGITSRSSSPYLRAVLYGSANEISPIMEEGKYTFVAISNCHDSPAQNGEIKIEKPEAVMIVDDGKDDFISSTHHLQTFDLSAAESNQVSAKTDTSLALNGIIIPENKIEKPEAAMIIDDGKDDFISATHLQTFDLSAAESNQVSAETDTSLALSINVFEQLNDFSKVEKVKEGKLYHIDFIN
jgi:hypothetical protein